MTRLAFFLYGNRVYKEFADRLPLDGSEQVLDFGCGMGTVAHTVAKRLPRGHLTCMDVSTRWLRACHRTLRPYKNVSFLRSNAASLTLTEDSFDVVYCHFVLHDITQEELERGIPVLTTSLKSGGVLVIREPLDEREKWSLIKRLARQHGLLLKNSRITDVPLLGNALESTYIKQ